MKAAKSDTSNLVGNIIKLAFAFSAEIPQSCNAFLQTSAQNGRLFAYILSTLLSVLHALQTWLWRCHY